ncbi:hypothetical protein Patl1_21524 [Pistacia atlantica]|uniref:Uncharacterized protein n=1 Tax=Pistacia atlantica TaxID=434234 RepID=A0ACC1BLT9_9ROSI|nr:hypothetical protein Patl1_21524 [Pistacia atlantica]
MLKKLRRRVKIVVTKPFKKPKKPFKPSTSICPPPPAPESESEPEPEPESTVLPDPSLFFSRILLSSPLPTNSFFQNFTLKAGDQPEYIHPYLIKSSQSSLSVSYPSQFHNSAFIYQVFNADLIISGSNKTGPDSQQSHVISSYSDLSVTLDIPSSHLRFFLVRGSPFVTCSVTSIIRIAAVPDSDPQYQSILDRFSSCYPLSGDAVFTKPFCLEYKFEKKGWGDLLMLAHPLHLKLLSRDDSDVTVLEDFKYKSIDGDLVGVVGDSWVLKLDSVSVTWHSINGIGEGSYDEIVSALRKDVDALNSSPITTASSYFYGKLIARAARLALIAEEVSFLDVIPLIRKFLKDTIEPWLDGTFSANGFLYDGKWGGIVTKQGSVDTGADFGFGVYNDHHYHLGYFVYAIAVLVKIDPAWGRKYRPQAYSLMADFMNLGRKANSNYPRLRCFDLYKLHSWAGGLTEFGDGRNQESTSEAVNAYYSAALMGLAYGDTHLVATGSMLASMEIKAAQTWWHIREQDTLYDKDFTRENRVVGVLWANKRDSGLWFAPPAWRECRLGIQLLPLLPITEVLFSDVGFTRELVQWTLPALGREGVGEGWKGFVYALEGIYDKENALQKIRNLNGYDDGNSLTNLLWWIHSRGDEEEEGYGGVGKLCWFRHYCH